MSFLRFFLGQKKKTAGVAKERLKIILAHERSSLHGASSGHDYLPQLQRELLEVIGKYVKIDPEEIKVNLERRANLDVLEVKIELPEASDNTTSNAHPAPSPKS